MKTSALKHFIRAGLVLVLACLQAALSLRGQVLPEAPAGIDLVIRLSDLPIGLAEAQISYPALAGHNYFVEYRDCLDPENPDCADWMLLPGAPHNAGALYDEIGLSERFYRVRVETIELTALPGRDQEALLGETVLLNGTDYAVGSGASSLDLRDLDGDGDLDIVTVAPGDGSLNSISVLLNRSE